MTETLILGRIGLATHPLKKHAPSQEGLMAFGQQQSRTRRALDRGNLLVAEQTALDVGHVTSADALEALRTDRRDAAPGARDAGRHGLARRVVEQAAVCNYRVGRFKLVGPPSTDRKRKGFTASLNPESRASFKAQAARATV